MSDTHSNESLLDMYLFETSQIIEQLEEVLLSSEKENSYSQEAINEIFRHMHTIKGSSGMMLFNNISTLAHSIEDLFFFLREQQPQNIDSSNMTDLILDGVDFIKVELEKIRNGDKADGDAQDLINNIRDFLELLKQKNPTILQTENPPPSEKQQNYIFSEATSGSSKKTSFKATITFKEDSEMENLRAYNIINNLKEFCDDLHYIPNDILENDKSAQIIRDKGFVIYVRTDKSYEEMHEFFMKTIFLKDLELIQSQGEEGFKNLEEPKNNIIESSPVKIPQLEKHESKDIHSSPTQNIISVNVVKLDKLMDLVGEIVIAEAMVIQNPDISGMEFENFHKAARQLHKITVELQDIVMSIRMLPLSNTFHKMQRIVRDMSKKLDKEVQLKLIGEETEVDKNIIEHISDPLMHLVRNSIDHGIESVEERVVNGKPKIGTITLEAKNAGNDVVVNIRDDGKGLNKDKILAKSIEHNLLTKPENEMTDKEIYNLIFIPGFSTKAQITEFSGRGVGMDVVVKNIGAVGGTVSVDSTPNISTTITLKIPLTLAIMDGMIIRVGRATYTVPIINIRESFRAKAGDVITDPDGNEMIMIRGSCYPILRLYERYHVKTDITSIIDGIILMVASEEKCLCILADELLGEQQVVVKPLPDYIKQFKKVSGLSGCTLLGDGSISLILDISTLIS